jgi:hypothetical protein
MFLGLVGFLLGLLAGIFLLVGLIPLLGWVNWITSLPLAVLGAIFGAVGRRTSVLATAALVLNLLIIAIALFRLSLGSGIL